MPSHDWTRLEPGDFHHFHQRWVSAIADALNSGLLPSEYMALTEPVTGRPFTDVVPRVEKVVYARCKNRVVIRHGRRRVVAIVEIVSPGNKDSRNEIRTFVENATDILNQGINLLVVDLFPPTSRNPQGIHKAIWDEFDEDEPFELARGKPLTVASYIGGDMPTAYVESVAVGEALPSMPIFLSEDHYIPAPLEETYAQSWAVFPTMLKQLIEARHEHRRSDSSSARARSAGRTRTPQR